MIPRGFPIYAIPRFTNARRWAKHSAVCHQGLLETQSCSEAGMLDAFFLDEIKVLQMINVKGKYREIILVFQARALS